MSEVYVNLMWLALILLAWIAIGAVVGCTIGRVIKRGMR